MCYTKKNKNTLIFPSIMLFRLECWFIMWIQSLKEWKESESQGDNQGNPTAANEKGTAISLYSWGPCTHTLGLEGLGPQPKNCGSVHWMAGVFRASTVHKMQCALSELHLRKHPGTGQGPAAEGSCHWGALSHWCASVQRPWKSVTKETKIHKDK